MNEAWRPASVHVLFDSDGLRIRANPTDLILNFLFQLQVLGHHMRASSLQLTPTSAKLKDTMPPLSVSPARISVPSKKLVQSSFTTTKVIKPSSRVQSTPRCLGISCDGRFLACGDDLGRLEVLSVRFPWHSTSID